MEEFSWVFCHVFEQRERLVLCFETSVTGFFRRFDSRTSLK